jgi:hypothetical protein
MDKRVETGREFWRAVLLAGGATAIPRWTLDPAPGVAEHVATLDDDLAAAVRRLAYGLELPLHSVALAAHAKVLAALSGGAGRGDRLRGRTRWAAAALPAHDRSPRLAVAAAGHRSGRVGPACSTTSTPKIDDLGHAPELLTSSSGGN